MVGTLWQSDSHSHLEMVGTRGDLACQRIAKSLNTLSSLATAFTARAKGLARSSKSGDSLSKSFSHQDGDYKPALVGPANTAPESRMNSGL
jgi:hypothetical protein